MTLELASLSKQAGAKAVLRRVGLQAETGQCVGVIGPNGAGKSTLFNLLTNVLLPDSGHIVLDGQALGDTFAVAVKRRMGALVNQGYLVEQLMSLCSLALAALFFLPWWWARIALALLVAASAAYPLAQVRRNTPALRLHLWQGIGA